MFFQEVKNNDRFMTISSQKMALPSDPESRALIESAIKIIMAKRINEKLKLKSGRFERKMRLKIEGHRNNYDE